MSEAAAVGLRGSLHLVCAHDPKRGTFLAQQAFSAPIHLSKSYWNGEVLLVNVINQTAGVFGGDGIVTRVVVEPGARVLLSSPSAARFHPSRGRKSRLEQTFEVRAGGSLDVFPEISIPHRDSLSSQETVIHVEQGGELIYLETLAPGRVASGEAFAFARYAWRTDIAVAGRAVHRERASLSPDDGSLAALTALFPVSYYAGIVLISPVAENWSVDFARAVAALGDAGTVKIAASQLCGGGWSIRLLARDGLTLRDRITRVRALIYRGLERSVPDPRR